MGTGAFTSVAAESTLDIDVADASTAMLAFETSNSRNGEYVDMSGGAPSIDLSPSNDNIMGEGVNENAQTLIRDIFDIRNQGPNGAFVWLNEAPTGFGLWSDFPSNTEPGGGVPKPGPTGPTTGIGPGGETGDDCLLSNEPLGADLCASIPARVYLGPGESLKEIGFAISTNSSFFGADAPVSGTLQFRAQDHTTFEGSVTRLNPHTVRVTDPTP